MFGNHDHVAMGGGDYVGAALKAAPPVVVTSAAAGGIPLEEWMYIGTLIYLALQAAYLLWRWARDIRRDRKGQADG